MRLAPASLIGFRGYEVLPRWRGVHRGDCLRDSGHFFGDDVDSVRVDAGDVDLVVEGDGREDAGDGVADLASGFFPLAEGEDRGACAGDGEAEGSGGEGCAFCLIEFRDQFLAAGFGDDVVDGA